jgi:hypothetical protein
MSIFFNIFNIILHNIYNIYIFVEKKKVRKGYRIDTHAMYKGEDTQYH